MVVTQRAAGKSICGSAILPLDREDAGGFEKAAETQTKAAHYPAIDCTASALSGKLFESGGRSLRGGAGSFGRLA